MGTRLATSHKTMDMEETESLYDDWASSYDECLNEWGYKVPSITADLFKTYFTQNNNDNNDKPDRIKIFDLGCGTGLVGKEIIATNADAILHGSDLSVGQFPMAEKKGYSELTQWDLNKFPFPFEDSTFDALTCAGTLTYAVDRSNYLMNGCVFVNRVRSSFVRIE